MERRQNARAFVKQWQADPVLPFSADVPPAAVGKRDKPPSLFRCVGEQGIEHRESVTHVPGQSVTYVPGSSHAEELFFKRERLKFRGLGRVHGDEKWWKHSSSHN
jgi:hypothetical protein